MFLCFVVDVALIVARSQNVGHEKSYTYPHYDSFSFCMGYVQDFALRPKGYIRMMLPIE